MDDFIVISTPEQELSTFLLRVVGLPAKDVQLRGDSVLSITTRVHPEEFMLIMGDREQAGLWHVVGSEGFRGQLQGVYSVLTVLASTGPGWFWTPERVRVLRNRFTKAWRIINDASDEPRSATTQAIVDQLRKENP